MIQVILDNCNTSYNNTLYATYKALYVYISLKLGEGVKDLDHFHYCFLTISFDVMYKLRFANSCTFFDSYNTAFRTMNV